jgi:hypothetical protein
MNNHLLNLEFRAKHVWRKTSSGKFTEKGGGVDGDYRYSKIELIDGSIPKIVIRYGNKPTVIAAVNSVRAQFHAEYEETVFLMLRNHVGWTEGMTCIYRVDFCDEIDSMFFLQTYNCMSAALLLSKGTKARGNVEVDELLADLVLDDEEKKKEDVIDVDADEEETDEETHNESEDPGDNDKCEDPGDEGEEEEEWDEDDEPNSQQVFPDGEYTADDLAAFKVAGIE